MKFHLAQPIEAKGQVKMGRAGPARPIAEEGTQNATHVIAVHGFLLGRRHRRK